MACAHMIRIVRLIAGARAREAAELCPKFGNAIREDRAVLHRERPNELDAALCNCLPFSGCEAERSSIYQFLSTKERRHSSVTECIARNDETEVRFLLPARA
jgi:hypothetical protein